MRRNRVSTQTGNFSATLGYQPGHSGHPGDCGLVHGKPCPYPAGVEGLEAGPSGSVEKSRQRRSRHFSVLTYYAYAPRVKTAAALLDGLF
ncbi:hypothetical protein [Candidatus Nitrospira neomarina]|uniref:Uncharacterized protein n=1 Tax=Candidatus Nitrospira neomarina TaxID=3020899 RepID=A0AA96GGM4_9BACT|nr:hypothetical protein [Candidatus Nitrospira neomarina]WNM60617.1 hypothetical protein PQG83_12700 [Candidatus Nitrospira neomarina]